MTEYNSIDSVSKRPLSEQVYENLLNSIVKGDLGPGTELKEKSLAGQMNVSATPVREALRRLASDGFVEIVPYRGAVVRQLDQKEIADAYACREVLEHLAVEECIENITDDDVKKLSGINEAYRTASRIEELSDLSAQFDSYIYRLSENSILIELLTMLKGIISRDRKYSSGNAERREEIYNEHNAIITALSKRNVNEAKEAVSIHIRNGRKFINEKSTAKS